MRARLGAILALLLSSGCTPWQTAVIGTSSLHPLGMWRGREVLEVEEVREGQHVPLTWSRALGVGLDPTWALVDFHDVGDPSAGTSVVVVEGLHRVDGTSRFPQLAGMIDRVLARHEIWVASHQSETEEVLAQFPDAIRDASAPEIEAVAWSTDRLEVTVRTTFSASEIGMTCGGARHPPSPIVRGGIEWTRSYDVTADGTVTPTSDDGGRILPGPPACDPRLP